MKTDFTVLKPKIKNFKAYVPMFWYICLFCIEDIKILVYNYTVFCILGEFIMTKIDLITGFLGVGKTTFIKRYADYLTSRGEKVHIIENDFGGLPIDARELDNEDFDVSQITGGCMCCTGRESFKNLLLRAGKLGYDRVLVEPSGIYDVNEFFKMIQNPPVSSLCEVGNVITIADSKSDDILSDEARALMFSQLIFTGCVILSKSQMRNQEEIDAAIDDLQGILDENKSTRNLRSENICIEKPWDEFDDSDFELVSKCGYVPAEHVSVVADHMSIFSASIMCGKFDTMEHLNEILHDLLNTEKYGKVYRIKGYISDVNDKWYEINCSSSGCFVNETKVPRGLFIVIGQGYDEEAIKKLFISRR